MHFLSHLVCGQMQNFKLFYQREEDSHDRFLKVTIRMPQTQFSQHQSLKYTKVYVLLRDKKTNSELVLYLEKEN